MTDTICLQCFKDLRIIQRAHQDHQLYHPPNRHPVHLPDNTNKPTAPTITYPDTPTDTRRTGKT